MLESPTSLLGRTYELDRIVTILNRRAPALVVVVGAPGKGKSRLLRAVQEWALRHDWKTLPLHPGDQLAVVPETTRDSFHEQLLTLPPALAEERFEADVHEERLRGLAATKSELPRPSPRTEGSADALLLGRLRELTPLLILIDGYAPEAEFEKWLLDSFVTGLQEAGDSTVVIIATERDRIDDPRVQRIVLSALDRAEVTKHFDTLGADVDPAMSEGERDHYIEVACETPVVVDSLERVLNLARRRRNPQP